MERYLRKASVTHVLIGINIICFIIVEIFGGSTQNTDILIRWGGAYVPYIHNGQYWRLFTAMFLHSGIRHLLNNMILLYVLGIALESQLGRVKYTVLYLGCGLIGNIVSYEYYLSRGNYTVSIGASGAIYAVMGALIWVVIRNKGRVAGYSIQQMLLLLAFSLYFGFTSAGVANSAHVAGLISGFLAAILLYRKPNPYKNKGGKFYV
jgi:rhomboid protease GluP